MIIQSYFKTTAYLLIGAMLMLASCSEDSMDNFSSSNPEGSEFTEYTACTDQSLYATDRELVTSELVGHYLKTRELNCGVAGCAEAPFVTVLFPGSTPSLSLNTDGVFESTEGPFEQFDSWIFLPANDSDVPNRFELIDNATPDDAFQVTILDVGPCQLRVENAQGWIEYTRLDEV